MASFAEIGDIELRWRPLISDEKPRAQILLEQASRLVLLRIPSVPSRVELGTLDPDLVADVVVGMVVRVLAAGVAGSAAVTQKSVTVGNITTSTSYASGSSGGLSLEPAELALLSLARKRAFGVDLTPVYSGRFPDAAS